MTYARRLQQAATVTSISSIGIMPTGSPAGWSRIYSEDFVTPSARGSFVNNPTNDWFITSTNPYANSLRSYPDGWNTTHNYSLNYASKTAEVLATQFAARGVFRLYAHTATISGTPQSLAGSFFPVINPGASTNDGKVSQIYGRYSARFRTVGGYGSGSDNRYGTAFLLWPANNNWPEGEIDYPEMGWGAQVSGFVHEIGNPTNNAAIISTAVSTDGDWHIATLEWYPTALVFYLDGVRLSIVNSNVPSTPFRWGVQSGGHDGTPPPNVSGYLLIDWLTVDGYNGAPVPT